MSDEIDFELLEHLEVQNNLYKSQGFSKSQREELLRLDAEAFRITEGYESAIDARESARAAADAAWADAGINPISDLATAAAWRANAHALADALNEAASATREAADKAAPADKAAAEAANADVVRALANALEDADAADAAVGAEAAYRAANEAVKVAYKAQVQSYEEYLRRLDAIRETLDEDAGDIEYIEMPPEPARNQAEPPGSEAAPTTGDASRLMGGEGASPTDALRDEAFSREEEGALKATAGAAPAKAGDADKIETPPDSVGHPIIGSFKDIDTQDVLGEAPVQNEAQEYQGIDTQEQSMFEAAPQWSVDQDQLLNPYEDDLTSSIPKDQLLNPYEDEPSPITEDELLNPYEEDDPSPISKDELLNPYEDDPSPIPKDELLNPYEDDPSSISEDQLLNPYENDAVIDLWE